MNVVVTQIYSKPGISFPFSARMQKHLRKALSSVVKPSTIFSERYGRDYSVVFNLSADTRIKTSVVKGPGVFKKTKDVEYSVFLPYDVIIRARDGVRSALSFLMIGIGRVLVALGLDTVAFDKRSGSLVDEICSDPGMLREPWPPAPTPKRRHRPVRRRAGMKVQLEDDEPPPKGSERLRLNTKLDGRRTRTGMVQTPPKWRIPSDLSDLIEEDLTWESTDWDPVLLTVMGGTNYGGRDIPLAWQIEFEPGAPELQGSSGRLSALNLEPDGYGWSTLISAVMKKRHPDLLDELHFGDTETETCVVWVESEDTCKKLINVVWELIKLPWPPAPTPKRRHRPVRRRA